MFMIVLMMFCMWIYGGKSYGMQWKFLWNCDLDCDLALTYIQKL